MAVGVDDAAVVSAAGSEGGSAAGGSSAGTAAVSSGLDTGGGVIATWLANQESNESAKQARDWQQQMASTSYQRTVADMKKAGLNPDLAVMGPGQSNVPSAQAAPVQKYDLGSSASKFWDTMQQQAGISSAQASAAASAANAKNTLESINTQRTQQVANSASAAESLARKELVDRQAEGVSTDNAGKLINLPYVLPQTKADVAKAQANAVSAAAQSIVNKSQAVPYQNPVVGGAMPWVDKGVQLFNDLLKGFGLILRR